MRITTARGLAAVARGRRLDLGRSQAAVAQMAEVSRKWLVDFERGKATVDLAHVLRVLDALDLDLQTVVRGTPTPTAHAEAPNTAGRVELDDLLTGYLER